MEFKSQDTQFKISSEGVGPERLQKDIQIGAGSSQFRVNQDGLFLGADDYASAPFKISFTGNLTATTGTLTGATIQTAAAGYRVKLSSSNGVEFLSDNTQKGIIYADTGDTLIIKTVGNIQCFAGTSSLGIWNTTGIICHQQKNSPFREAVQSKMKVRNFTLRELADEIWISK